MRRPSRIVKRLLLPALLALALIAVQVVLAAPPQPSFTVVGPNFTTTCGLYTFTSTTTDADAGEPPPIDWDIAGTPRSGSSVTETFATPGQRTINMTATDTDAGDGTVDVVAATPQTVTVGNGGIPNAAFSAGPNPAQPGETITFNAAASTAQGGDPSRSTSGTSTASPGTSSTRAPSRRRRPATPAPASTTSACG